MVKVVKKSRLMGTRALASELGVSAGHLSAVFHGKRRSPTVEAKFKELGIKYTAYKGR